MLISSQLYFPPLKKLTIDINDDDKKLIIELTLLYIGAMESDAMDIDKAAYFIIQRIPCLQLDVDKNLIVIKDVIEKMSMEVSLLPIDLEKIDFKRWVGNDLLIGE